MGAPFLSRLRNRSLRARLQLMMLSLLALSIGSLFVLHLFSERALLARVRDYTEELSTAIEIMQEQPGAGADPQKSVQAYAEKLRELGVRDVSIADASAEVVQASTNPRIVGRKLGRRRGPAEYVIRGVLGEEGPLGRPTTSNLTVPIVVGDRRVGYVVITRILDDFSVLSETALASRVAATLAVFALGMLLSLFLASAVSRPVQALTDAAKRVAAGDLSARVPASGSDELGALARTFNQMVERLGESRALEERLRVAERSTAMGRFASALAHEIRNPLNSISLTIDHVRTRLAPADAERHGGVPGPDDDAQVGGDAPEPPRRGLSLLRPAGAARPAPVRRGRRRARDGRARPAQGPRPGDRGRAWTWRRASRRPSPTPSCSRPASSTSS